MLVTTICCEYWERDCLDYTFYSVESFYVSATSCVFSVPPIDFRHSGPGRISCWRNSYVTQSLLVAVKVEQSVSAVDSLGQKLLGASGSV